MPADTWPLNPKPTGLRQTVHSERSIQLGLLFHNHTFPFFFLFFFGSSCCSLQLNTESRRGQQPFRRHLLLQQHVWKDLNNERFSLLPVSRWSKCPRGDPLFIRVRHNTDAINDRDYFRLEKKNQKITVNMKNEKHPSIIPLPTRRTKRDDNLRRQNRGTHFSKCCALKMNVLCFFLGGFPAFRLSLFIPVDWLHMI